MSADNCVAILETSDKFLVRGHGMINQFGKPIRAYRVAHASAIDNFSWYMENEPHNLGHYMYQVWGRSKVYYSKEEAMKKASEILASLDICEYGILNIQATEYCFPM